MKKWKKYINFLQQGDWHVHTNYTDGKNNIFECCEQAEKNGLKIIVFTEHVRKDLTYCFDDYMSEIYSAKDKFDIHVVGGCETKVIDRQGNLDAEKKILCESEIISGVFHSFKKEDYLVALSNMLKNKYVDIWGHSTLFAEKNNLNINTNVWERIIKTCIDNEVIIENNFKYNVPNKKFIELSEKMGAVIVKGSDAHNKEDILNVRI